MLNAFRDFAQGKAIKLLLILIMSTFVLWGVSSIFSSTSSIQNAAKVGSNTITEETWYKILGQQISFREKLLGRKLTNDELNDPQFRTSVLDMLIHRELLKLAAAEYDLLIDDEIAAVNIRNNSIFHDEAGKLDYTKLQLFLKNQGLSERQFFDIVKDDLRSSLIAKSLTQSDLQIEGQVEQLLRAYYAKHYLDIYRLKDKDFQIAEQPTANELENIYQKEIAHFTVPEKRNVSYVTFNEGSVEITKSIPAAELNEYYQTNLAKYEVPEKREVYHLSFPSKEVALQRQAEVKNFEDFKKLAGSLGVKLDDPSFALGAKARDELLPMFAEAIFAADEGILTEIISSQMGYHIFFIRTILAPWTKSLEQAKPDIEKDIMANRKERELNKLAQEIDRDLISGLSLRDIAENYGLKVVTKEFIYDFNGSDQAANDPLLGEIKAKAKEQEINLESGGRLSDIEFESSTDTYYIFHVNNVYAEALRPFEEVESELRSIWHQERRAIGFKQLFNKLTQLINDGNTEEIANFIKENKITLDAGVMVDVETQKFSPDNMDILISLLPSNVSDPLYDQVSHEFFIAHCTKIDAPMPSKSEGVEKTQQNIEEILANGNSQALISQYYKSLREKYKVQVNNKIVYREINVD